MEKQSVNQLAEEIARKVDVKKIYGINYGKVDTVNCHLLILLPAGCGTKFTEVKPFINMVLDTRDDISFGLFQESEVRSALKSGNIFFHTTCTDKNLLYRNPGSPAFPPITAGNLLQWKEEAYLRFNDGINKTTSFLTGADFYYKKNDLGLTVFMLHQVAELTYRALELFILPKEKRTHNISMHQSYLQSFIPQLEKVFPDDTPAEKEILMMLNNAYSAVRYEQNYCIDEKYIPILYERVGKLQENVALIVHQLSEILDNEYKESLILESTTVSGQRLTDQSVAQLDNNKGGQEITFFSASGKLKEVFELIIEHLSPDQVYVFGNTINQSARTSLFALNKNDDNQSLHYDLLVISSLLNPYSTNIYDLIKELGGITINLLIHNKDEVIKKIESRNRFFETVIRYGYLIYSKTTFIDSQIIPKIDINLIYNKTKTCSTCRIHRASAILKAAQSVEHDVTGVAVSLLAQSMEQACLGVIYAFWGYCPNLHSLPHLLAICKTFWPDEQQFFPTQTLHDKHLLTILSRSRSELRFSLEKSIGPEDFSEISLRCINFIGSAEIICVEELEDLERQSKEIIVL
jgi:HEPN domain-containing protein